MEMGVQRMMRTGAGSVRRHAPGWIVGLLAAGLLVACGSSAQAWGPRVTRLVFTTVAFTGRAPSRAVTDRTVGILRARLRSISPGASVSRTGDRIVVRVPSAQVFSALAMTAPGRLEFYDWEVNALTPERRTVASGLRTHDQSAVLISQGSETAVAGAAGAGSMSLYDAVKLASTQPAQRSSKSARRGPDYYMFAAPGSAACATAAKDQNSPAVVRIHCLLSGPDATKRDLISGLPAGVSPAQGQILTVPQGTTVLQATPSSLRNPPSAADPAAQFFVLEDRPALTNRDIVDPRESTDQTGSPDVTFSFTTRGQRVFRDVTAAIARRAGSLSAHGPALYQHFAVVVDNGLIDVPDIDYTAYPDGVSGANGADIVDGFTAQSGRELATVLRYGPLPVGLSATVLGYGPLPVGLSRPR
jgi:hypothetical protein